jgi:hypothetical protein
MTHGPPIEADAAASYYGRPVVKPHVWKAYIPWYFWIGGTAGAAAVQCVAARARGEHRLALVYKRTALAGVLIAPPLLIADLGVPLRFLNMLRVFKPTSPMSVGSWVLSAFGGAIATSTLAELLGWEKTSRALEVATALFGPGLTVYTAVLVADTATPIWHDAYEDLPHVFAASGVASAAAMGVMFAPAEENRFARRLMTLGAIALPVGAQIMERRLGAFQSEPYRTGKGGSFRRMSGGLALLGAALSIAGGRNRTVSRVAAGFVAGAGIFERFAVMAAGKQSAQDPKYTVKPQRERADARGPAQVSASG